MYLKSIPEGKFLKLIDPAPREGGGLVPLEKIQTFIFELIAVVKASQCIALGELPFGLILGFPKW